VTDKIDLPKGQGYVKVYRRIMDSSVWQNEKLLKVWIWCLLKANHKEAKVPVTTGKGSTIVPLKPGQFIYGRDKAAEELGMPASTVRNQIKILKENPHGYIEVTPVGRLFSVVTILNWDYWQNDCEHMTVVKPDDELGELKWTAKGQPKDINNNNKNNKNNIIDKDINKNKDRDLETSSPLAHFDERLLPKCYFCNARTVGELTFEFMLCDRCKANPQTWERRGEGCDSPLPDGIYGADCPNCDEPEKFEVTCTKCGKTYTDIIPLDGPCHECVSVDDEIPF